jgi:hypothetical protein
MSVSTVMSELATNPVRLAEYRVDPVAFAAKAQLEETAITAVASRDSNQIRQALFTENGGVASDVSAHYVIVLVLEIAF